MKLREAFAVNSHIVVSSGLTSSQQAVRATAPLTISPAMKLPPLLGLALNPAPHTKAVQVVPAAYICRGT